MKLLLVTPPTVQLNTPYPATPFLAGYLRGRGYEVAQADAGLELALRLFSGAGVRAVVTEFEAAAASARAHPAVAHLLAHAEEAAAVADPVLALLSGADHSLVHRIAARTLLPEGPRFAQMGSPGHEQTYLEWAFGGMGVSDRARYFATLFLEDLADAVQAGVDPCFELARYAPRLAHSPPAIAPLLVELEQGASRLTTRLLGDIAAELVACHHPDVVGLTLPFPGTVLGALRLGKALRACAPAVRLVWGGGWVNTELRDVAEPRLFDYVDAVTYDAGERPLECLLEHYAGARPASRLLRTRLVQDGAVVWRSSDEERDVPFADAGTPSYAGLPLARYLSLVDVLNPMQRLWSDTRWNKLLAARGCYWQKCAFCNLSLPAIAHYEPLAATQLVARIEALIAETGGRAFHFVDEAAPPALLAAMAEELIARRVAITWFGNIRFEKAFTPARCRVLARCGCVAVSGGLEVASDRLLRLMRKGVSVEQVARVTKGFADAGVRVHAYLMYGFPSESEQETVDSLELVRQLFAAGCLDSAYWHDFAATAHSPVGMHPERYGIRLLPHEPAAAPAPVFARNDLPFVDEGGCAHERFAAGLRNAVYNYMHGLGLEEDVRAWFDFPVPKSREPRRRIERALAASTRS